MTGLPTPEVVVRIVTYNVNSLPMRLTRVLALLEEHRPDVVCLQETKVTAAAFPEDQLRAVGYASAHHSAGRWAGVAVLAREELGLDDVVTGLEGEVDADEARWVEATVGRALRVVSVYVPNGRAVGTPTFAAKLRYLEAMARRAAVLACGPAVIGGDVNVCPSDLDVWDVAQVHGATHITHDERSRLQAVLDAGFVDAYRHLEPDEPGFTWWDYRAGHFHKGFGLRIDLAMVSRSLADRIVHAGIDRAYRKPTKVPGTRPSDHAPLLVDLDLQLDGVMGR